MNMQQPLGARALGRIHHKQAGDFALVHDGHRLCCERLGGNGGGGFGQGGEVMICNNNNFNFMRRLLSSSSTTLLQHVLCEIFDVAVEPSSMPCQVS